MKIMRTTLNILIPLIFVGASSMASAQEGQPKVATLDAAEGTVMVDKGKGYVSTQINAPLNEGDRVITLGNSTAEIVFADGCKLMLKPNNLVKIERTLGCKAAIAAVDSTAPASAARSGAPSIGPVLLGLGTIAALAIVDHDDKPISGQ
jgi:hypothetical protein